MTKTEWKLFALWAAAEWAERGPFEWDDWYESHRRSARTLGIPASEAEFRSLFDFCKLRHGSLRLAESIEGMANALYPEQFKKAP